MRVQETPSATRDTSSLTRGVQSAALGSARSTLADVAPRTGGPLIAGAMSVLGMGVLLVATPWGLNLTDDSQVYVSAARNVLRGYGVGLLNPDGSFGPLRQYPPLYPLVLAAAAAVSGLDVIAAARWVEALLFGATILLVCLTVATYNRGFLLAPIIGGLFTIFGGSLLVSFGAAMSEGLFILSGALGLRLLVVYLERRRRPWVILVGAAAATAAALLTRFAGVAVVGTAVVLLLVSGGGGLRRRIWSAGIFLLLSVGPLPFWLATLGTSTPALSGAQPAAAGPAIPVVAAREFALHPVTPKQLAYGPLNVVRWLVPEGVLRSIEATAVPVWSIGGAVDRAALVGLVAACALGGLLVFRALIPRGSWARPSLPGLAAHVIILFMVVYVGFLLLTMSVATPSTELSPRTLTPLYVAMVVVLPSVLLRWWRWLSGRRTHQRVLAALVALVLVGNVVQTGLWVRQGNLDGLGYGSRAWQQSTLVARARAVPPEQQVYTNGTIIMGLYSDRLADFLPETDQPDQRYVARLEEIKTRLQQHTAVLVYFDELRPPHFPYPSIEELRQSIPLRVLDAEADGAIYTAD